jgi:transcriptional regulator
MYIPAPFAERRPNVLANFIRQNSFGTLVTSDPQSGVCASHLPFLFREAVDGAPPMLLSHVARQNDQWRTLRPDTEVLAIFQGPHAYISPRWYVSKLAVPTWNYTAVHVYGRPRLIEDPPAVRQLLSQIVTTYEGTGANTWSDSALPDDFVEKLAAAVVAFAIDVTRIEGKFKLSQNRPMADREAVIAALEAENGGDAAAVARLMRQSLPASQ